MRVIPNEFTRRCTVIKNRFRNKADANEWIPELKELTWEGIKKLTKLAEGEFVE